MKKQNYLLILFLIFSTFSCSNRNESKIDDEIQAKFLKEIQSTPKSDTQTKIIWSDYESGNKKVVYQFFTSPANFDDDHYYQEFYENGNKKIQGLEHQKVRMGIWSFYHENSQLAAKMTFDNDTLKGLITIFDFNGRAVANDTVINGQLQRQNIQVAQFIRQNSDFLNLKPIWRDSLINRFIN